MSKMSFLNFKTPSSTNPNTSSKKLRPKSSTGIRDFQPNFEELKRIFDKYDANGDGRISLEEYSLALKVLGGAAASKNEAELEFKAADGDGDGFIDFKEFAAVQNSEGGVKSREIQAAFRVFDGNADGKISAEELNAVMRRIGMRCSVEECRGMIKGVDRDGDGFIDIDEFVIMMTYKQ